MDGCFCSACQPRVTITRLREKGEKMQAIYQPKRKLLVGKSVNGGPPFSMGYYETREETERAIEALRAFHLERCPKDVLRFSIDGEEILETRTDNPEVFDTPEEETA